MNNVRPLDIEPQASDVPVSRPPASWKTRLRRYRLIIGMMFLFGFGFLGLAVWDKYREVTYRQLGEELGRQGVKITWHTVRPEWVQTGWGRRLPEFMGSWFDTKVHSAEFQGKGFGADALRRVLRLPELVWLTFHETACLDRESMELIGKTPTLTYLILRDEQVTDESVRLLGQLQELTTIYVESPRVTEACVKDLQMLKKVQSVGVHPLPENLKSVQLVAVQVKGPRGDAVVRVGEAPTMRVTLQSKKPLAPAAGLRISSLGTGWSSYLNVSGFLTKTPAGFYEFVGTAGVPCEHAGVHETQITLNQSGKPVLQLIVGKLSFVVEARLK